MVWVGGDAGRATPQRVGFPSTVQPGGWRQDSHFELLSPHLLFLWPPERLALNGKLPPAFPVPQHPVPDLLGGPWPRHLPACSASEAGHYPPPKGGGESVLSSPLGQMSSTVAARHTCSGQDQSPTRDPRCPGWCLFPLFLGTPPPPPIPPTHYVFSLLFS